MFHHSLSRSVSDVDKVGSIESVAIIRESQWREMSTSMSTELPCCATLSRWQNLPCLNMARFVASCLGSQEDTRIDDSIRVAVVHVHIRARKKWIASLDGGDC